QELLVAQQPMWTSGSATANAAAGVPAEAAQPEPLSVADMRSWQLQDPPISEKQMTYLLDLGHPREQLGSITKSEASWMITRDKGMLQWYLENNGNCHPMCGRRFDQLRGLGVEVVETPFRLRRTLPQAASIISVMKSIKSEKAGAEEAKENPMTDRQRARLTRMGLVVRVPLSSRQAGLLISVAAQGDRLQAAARRQLRQRYYITRPQD
ncbi:hypothetical protein Agub_g4248, partial [Astrephomene gubernaculifera]